MLQRKGVRQKVYVLASRAAIPPWIPNENFVWE